MAKKFYKYKIDEHVTINKFAVSGIPQRIGEIAKIKEYIEDSPKFDYLVEFKDGDTAKVRESEINKVYVPNMKVENGVIVEHKGTDKYLHKSILDEIHDTYIRKNADYGNSFGDQFNEYGLLSAIIRFDDKIRRVKQLNKHVAQVKDESIRDTVLDLANYAIMTVMELDKQNK